MPAYPRCLFPVLSLFLASPVAAQPPPFSPPVFRSGVELVAIDATIVDSDGRPIVGLGPADFDIQVDGRPRRTVTAEFVQYRSGALRDSHAPAPVAAYSSNETDTPRLPPDRFIMLAFDHASFTPLGAKPAVEAARRFLEKLDPSDRVAFVSFPSPGLFVPHTADRSAIEQALSRVVGSADRSGGMSQVTLSLSEAVDISDGNLHVRNLVVERECGRVTNAFERAACVEEVAGSSREVAAEAQQRAATTLRGLEGVIRSLERLEGRKTLVFVNAGLFSAVGRSFDDGARAIDAAVEAAASANVAIHVLYVETGSGDAIDADRLRVSETRGSDRSLMASGLEYIAGASGGSLTKVVAGADFAFDRVTRELSAFYALAIESEPGDRDGRRHRISVRVRRAGAQVRHRQAFEIAAASVASAEERLAEALGSGRTVRDVPLRAATLCLKDATSDKVRVLVRLDIGRAVAATAEMRVGLAVLDREGQLASSAIQTMRLKPSTGPDAAWPFLGAVLLAPGSYTMRAAVVDGEMRTGSVVHRFDATLQEGVDGQISDLLVFDPARFSSDELSPVIDGRIDGTRLTAFIEAYPSRRRAVTRVEFTLGDGLEQPPIFRQAGRVTPVPDDSRSRAETDFDLVLLPPGDYTIAATAFVEDAVIGRATRAIRVERRVEPGGGSTGLAGPPRLRFAPGVSGALSRPFAPADVLRRDALDYFFARLRSADVATSAPAVAQAIAAAERGEFGATLEAVRGADATRLAVPFLRGLALFARGELEQAAEQFRAALDVASDFLPAAFYLGACYAAGGRDEYAAAAWQTALNTEGDARIIYYLLADAFLRLSDGPQALAILAEARGLWPEDDLFLPRLAAAQSLTGQARPAVETLDAYLTRHPDDQETTFLALRLLYEVHVAGSSVRTKNEDADRAEALATQYRAASGPHVALADRWTAFIRRSAAGKD